jgi:hypothetical protein
MTRISWGEPGGDFIRQDVRSSGVPIETNNKGPANSGAFMTEYECQYSLHALLLQRRLDRFREILTAQVVAHRGQ